MVKEYTHTSFMRQISNKLPQGPQLTSSNGPISFLSLPLLENSTHFEIVKIRVLGVIPNGQSGSFLLSIRMSFSTVTPLITRLNITATVSQAQESPSRDLQAPFPILYLIPFERSPRVRNGLFETTAPYLGSILLH